MEDWRWMSLLLIAIGLFFFFVGDAKGRQEWDQKHRDAPARRDADYYRARERYIAARRPFWTKISGFGSIIGGFALLLL